MLTECPHCLTVLKVSAELIYAGDPRVRCGECLRVFSSRDHLTQSDGDLDTTKIYQPTKRETIATTEPVFSLQPEVAEGLQALMEKPRSAIAATSPAPQPEHPPIERTRRAAIPSQPAEQKNTSGKARKQPSNTRKTSTATTPHAAMSDTQTGQPKDRHISVLSQNKKTGRSAPSRSWSAVTVLLLGALTLLAIDAVRSVWTNPVMRENLSAAWCDVANCATAASRDFSELQIVRRKIYAHPNAQGVLVISLAMVNRLDQNMDYPNLMVRMTDRDGEVIARGHFEPSHYVPNYREGMTIEPERVLDVVLQVEDPGESAQSFDLEFL